MFSSVPAEMWSQWVLMGKGVVEYPNHVVLLHHNYASCSLFFVEIKFKFIVHQYFIRTLSKPLHYVVIDT